MNFLSPLRRGRRQFLSSLGPSAFTRVELTDRRLPAASTIVDTVNGVIQDESPSEAGKPKKSWEYITSYGVKMTAQAHTKSEARAEFARRLDRKLEPGAKVSPV